MSQEDLQALSGCHVAGRTDVSRPNGGWLAAFEPRQSRMSHLISSEFSSVGEFLADDYGGHHLEFSAGEAAAPRSLL